MEERPYAFLAGVWHDAMEKWAQAAERLKQLEDREPDVNDGAYLEWQEEKSRVMRDAEQAWQLSRQRWIEYVEGTHVPETESQ